MVHQRMFLEERLQDIVVVLLLLVERQVHLRNLDLGEVIHHIVSEARLTVCLLLGAHASVACLFHQGDLLFLVGNEHQHLRSEVSAGERVLSEER